MIIKLTRLLVCFALFAAGAIMARAGEMKPPILFLPFDEIKNGTTPNLGSVLAVPATEGVSLMEGKFGKAVRFSGSNAKIEIPMNLHETALYGLTISVWLKCENSKVRNGTIFLSGIKNNGMDMRTQWNSSIDCSFAGLWHAIKVEKLRNLQTEWTHVAFTYDGKISRLFINGDLAGEKKMEAPFNYGDTICLGRLEEGAPITDSVTGETSVTFDQYQGGLDNLKVFDYALTPEELATLDQ